MKPSLKSQSDARLAALHILDRAEATGADLSLLLGETAAVCDLDRRDQSLMTELVYGVSRQIDLLDWWIAQFSKVKHIKRPTQWILRLALYQMVFLDRIPDYAVVNASVNLAKTVDGRAAGGFVNGLLRTVLRTQNNLPEPDAADSLSYISISTSHPKWLVKRWLTRWGKEKTLAFCRANNEIPPLCLRVNRLKTDRETLMASLIQEGATVSAGALSPDAIFVKGLSLTDSPAFLAGHFYVQDEGAQLTSHLLSPQAGEQILDLCAAPGGKTTHLSELTAGKSEITATDRNKMRLAILKENVARLQTPNITVMPLQEALADGESYDRILVDAPCSALGVLRRIPEGKRSKKDGIVAGYAAIQADILKQAVSHLKVGGSLLYVTCSTEPEENEQQAEVFSAAHPELRQEDLSLRLPEAARAYVGASGCFTTAFNSDKMDGFFACCWRRIN